MFLRGSGTTTRTLARTARIGARSRTCVRTNYTFNHFQSLEARPSRFKRFLYANMALVAATSVAYYLWWPKHTFPSLVAKILRKGLWAESDRGEHDYQLALKHYLEALEECGLLKMDPLCDEYTGIQLKICEMYERLGMVEDAAFVYNEIATLYLSVLKAPADLAQGKRIRGIDHRAHVIQKDLRIALKLVELNKANLLLAKAILVTHLLVAQEEVNRKLGHDVQVATLLDGTLHLNNLNAAAAPTVDLTGDEPGQQYVVEANPAAWSPFSDEFFTAMDLLSALCVTVGDIDAAAGIRVAMTGKMLVAGVAPEKLLLLQCNTASLLYFQAEKLQGREQLLRRQFAEKAGVDYEVVKAIANPLVLQVEVSEKEAAEITQQLADAASDTERAEYETVVANKEKLMDLVVQTYDSVILGSKRLPQDLVKNNPTILETVALATYGLGVVKLHLSKYDDAERLLREARVRSKACGYDALIEEIERELGKVTKERRALEERQE